MKKIIIAIVLILGIAFAWWTIAPLFITKTVDDTLDPEIEALLTSMPEEPAIANPAIVTISDSGETMIMPIDPVTSPESEVITESTTPTPDPAAPKVTGPFTIEDTRGHPASGSVRVIETAEQSVVRFEEYEGTNGPDLFVYLAKDLDANEFVNLGRAKGNQGNINYTVPEDVDLSEYKYVMTWCRAFGVLFDFAEIN